MTEQELRAIDEKIAKWLGWQNIRWETGPGQVVTADYSGKYKQLLGEPPDKEYLDRVPDYSTDWAFVPDIEKRIAELDLKYDYMSELLFSLGFEIVNNRSLWAMLTATPLQRCQAALETLEADKKGETGKAFNNQLYDRVVKAVQVNNIEIDEPPDNVCPWGHTDIVKDRNYPAKSLQMYCRTCKESFQPR